MLFVLGLCIVDVWAHCRSFILTLIESSTCGLVAMTSAPHAECRQFDPGQVYFSEGLQDDRRAGRKVTLHTLQITPLFQKMRISANANIYGYMNVWIKIPMQGEVDLAEYVFYDWQQYITEKCISEAIAFYMISYTAVENK